MSKERITDIRDICPVCAHPQQTFSKECDDCGYPLGKDWQTVEVDLETDVIVRTVVPAQPPLPDISITDMPAIKSGPGDWDGLKAGPNDPRTMREKVPPLKPKDRI